MAMIQAVTSRLGAMAGGIFLALMLAMPASAQGQSFPNKPLRWIIGSVPGGGQDVTARLLAAIIAKSIGQQIVLENRGGAGGTLAVDAAAKAAPDGYTYAVTSNGAMLNAPALYPNLPYDPAKDVVPIGMTFLASFVIVAGPKTPVASIQEMIAEVKAKPGQHAYALAGKGSPHFLAMELFKHRAGLTLPDVPYRSTVPAAADAAAGEVAFSMVDAATGKPHFDTGKLRPLAVTSRERWKQFPNVPTVAEAVSPGFEAFAWNAIVAPAGTPRDIVARMSAELKAAVSSPEASEAFARIGFTAWPTTSEEAAQVIKDGLAVWPDLIRALGIKGE